MGITYYYDLKRDKRIMSKRQRREEIIWYGIVYKGRSKIIFLDNKVNTLKYSDFSTNH